MRIVSWNLAKRYNRAVEVLEHLDHLGADVVLLQESKAHAVAEERGWTLVRAAESPSDCVILGRADVDLRRAKSSAVSQLGRYIAHAEVTIDGRTTDLISVHPLAKVVRRSAMTHLRDIDVDRPSDPRVWQSDLFLFLIQHAVAGRSAVVGGDWNTSRLFQESLFDRAAKLGWCDVVVHVLGQEQRTWFRGVDRAYGLDHVFCTSDLQERIKDGFVDATAADSAADHVGRGLSDHAPVIVDLDL